MLYVFWLLCAVGAGIVASSKGRSGVGWFLLSLLLFGVLGLLIVGFMPPVGAEPELPRAVPPPDAQRRVPCPSCREMIVEGATTCRFCGKPVEAGYAGPVPAHLREGPQAKRLWE